MFKQIKEASHDDTRCEAEALEQYAPHEREQQWTITVSGPWIELGPIFEAKNVRVLDMSCKRSGANTTAYIKSVLTL
ncbi:hypothetical protein [Spirosoma fluminis]